MKFLKFSILLMFLTSTKILIAQSQALEIAAVKADDVKQLSSLVNDKNLNACFPEGDYSYTLLAQAVRNNAQKCFDILISKGANVNTSCDGYVPPIMHAAKYGRLEMLKVLIAKGADKNYVYHGEYTPADGETPLTYAEKYKQTAIVDYLKSLQK